LRADNNKDEEKEMPDQNVNLQVTAAQSPLPAAWTLCQNNSNYMYKYTGGNPTSEQPSGSFNFTHGPSGSKTVQIGLTGSSGFAISSVRIGYDDDNDPKDLSSAANTNGTWTITDTDVDAESGYYNVFVNDTTNSVNGIECDPRWKNN
jgi:hypothetical protein